MKCLLYTFLLLCSICLQAQFCPIPNGSFEDWEDITLELDTTGTLPAETVLVPENFFPFIRLFLASFGQVFGAVTDIDLAQDYLGVERSEDASNGNYSLKLVGNSILPLADAAAIFPCDGVLPDFLYMDLKHVGTGRDSMDFYLTFGQTVIIPEDLNDLFRTSGFIVGQVVADINTEWATLELPITDNEVGISADSVFLWFINSSDSLSIANGEESYFLIDNLTFNQFSATHEPELNQAVKMYPMPFRDKLYFENENEILNARLYDTQGRLKSRFEVEAGTSERDMQFLLESGNYILELYSEKQQARSHYNIIKQ